MAAETPSPNEIDLYIAKYPPDVAAVLSKVRETIRKAAPNATETIKYGLPTFVLNGNLVHFGGFKSHVGFYPTPSGISQFQEEISKYKSAKGSVQFPLDQKIPYSLIAKIVKFRVKENSAKSV